MFDFLKDMGNGTMKLVTATATDEFTNSEARGAAVTVGLIAGIGMGMIARNRTENGYAPIAGFIA